MKMSKEERLVEDVADKAAENMLDALQRDHEMIHNVVDIECYKIVTIQGKMIIDAAIQYMFHQFAEHGGEVPKNTLNELTKFVNERALVGFALGLEHAEERRAEQDG